MQTPGLFDWMSATVTPPCPSVNQLRDDAMRRALDAAEAKRRGFRDAATAFVVGHLRTNGPTSGEVLTDLCKAAGIRPDDDRAFGAVYMSLARRGTIQKVGTVNRLKGHNTAGGNVWGLT